MIILVSSGIPDIKISQESEQVPLLQLVQFRLHCRRFLTSGKEDSSRLATRLVRSLIFLFNDSTKESNWVVVQFENHAWGVSPSMSTKRTVFNSVQVTFNGWADEEEGRKRVIARRLRAREVSTKDDTGVAAGGVMGMDAESAYGVFGPELKDRNSDRWGVNGDQGGKQDAH